MRLDDEEQSSNVEDRRGGGVGAGGLSIGAVVVALVASYFFGVSPSTVLGLLGQSSHNNQPVAAHKPPADDRMAVFVAKVLHSTETTWEVLFRESGKHYQDPKLVLFSGSTPTACGAGQAAMGPFYCPGDRQVYIDLAFYQDLKDRFKAPGEFAEAYVIAHEVGHHVQNLLGISGKVHAAQQRAHSKAQANALSVRLELQADCYAGIWANRSQQAKQWLDADDIESAVNAAQQIGDDTLQKRGQGYAVPDSFTHGSSAQRVRWFMQGYKTGSVQACDTFNAQGL